ncbi:hypothetical protein C8Q74DRAFT_1442079 [Fomes fomentarius]|nr:hypothetical protein C8Q74DRAFT_1442079 [Fomes fomentarius]
MSELEGDPERPPKRAPNEVADGPLTHWLDYGNIALVARNAAVRVYLGVLAAQSTVCYDMFASSSSRADDSAYAGCPLVRHSDSLEDLRYFLRVLLPKTQRMYHVEDILSQALSALRSYHKDDFGNYDSDSEVSLNFEATSKNHHIDAVNFARLTNPLVDGCEREDGSIEHLTTEDFRSCIDGRDRLAEEAFSVIRRIFRPRESEECANDGKLCRAIIRKMSIDAVENDDAFASTVLQLWKLVIADRAKEHGLCETCTKELLHRDVQARRDIFDEIAGTTWRQSGQVGCSKWGRGELWRGLSRRGEYEVGGSLHLPYLETRYGGREHISGIRRMLTGICAPSVGASESPTYSGRPNDPRLSVSDPPKHTTSPALEAYEDSKSVMAKISRAVLGHAPL